MFLDFFEKWQIKSIFMLKQKSKGLGKGVVGVFSLSLIAQMLLWLFLPK